MIEKFVQYYLRDIILRGSIHIANTIPEILTTDFIQIHKNLLNLYFDTAALSFKSCGGCLP